MSASQYRRQLENKQKQQLDAERRVGEYRSKESKKRADASKARLVATKTTSTSTASSRLREAQRRDTEAAQAGKDAANWQARAASYAKEAASLQTKLVKAEQAEALAAQRAQAKALESASRMAAANQSALEARVARGEATVRDAVQQIRAPRQEKLRILILGASSDGGLRVGREQTRIRRAVQSAEHRDLIELDVRPAATTEDLLDGSARFRPHIVHFSGHSDDGLIEFEDEVDEPHDGVVVTARAFASAVRAVDEPPLLIVLNSCNSAAQIDALVEAVAPFAIGMADEIDDADAIGYAAHFYAALANGQSIGAAHGLGRAALELGGLAGAELPTLAVMDGFDSGSAVLVKVVA
ncbi:hypothetical protein P9139_02990 [Curtobacterium flaccumfaciens]|nr:hypothetical protein P9139_02990 [Curtobacterium flaccumfaciens]